MQTEYPPHVPLTFHRGSVTNGNGQELPNEAYLTYGSAAAMNAKDAEVEIHGGGAHEAARMIAAAPEMLAALKGLLEAAWPHVEDENHEVEYCRAARAAIDKAEGITTGAT